VVPDATTTSSGHTDDVPEHTSATSHPPSAPRHSLCAGANVHVCVQHAPPSHCSPISMIPLPQTSPVGLSAGPFPDGVYDDVRATTILSTTNPSSRIHTTSVCTPVVVTLIVARNPPEI